MIDICIVCWGNICRSPIAEGVLRALVDEAGLGRRISVDSAGTSSEHIGDPPDRRARAEANRRGIDINAHRGWRFEAPDFSRFNLVLAVDDVNLERLLTRARTPADEAKLHLLRSFDPAADPTDDPYGLEVPDPYYGGQEGFALVYDLVDRACRGVLDHVRRDLLEDSA